ncbi:MAG: hypothetical protein E6X17_09725 [Sporomusaceae bacterium]|nr:hypothetical protein [Sporomusaceae bacterium]
MIVADRGEEMADQNEKKTKHLRSARQWLTRAEESFDKDRDIRGELNLFLAQAELQHAKEAGQKQGWIQKQPALRHALASVVALLLAGAAYGFYYPAGHSVQPASSPTGSPPVSQFSGENKQVFLQSPPAMTAPAVRQQNELPPVSDPAPIPVRAEPRRETVVAPAAAQPQPVSSDEMKNLIRAAGKSLRGE